MSKLAKFCCCCCSEKPTIVYEPTPQTEAEREALAEKQPLMSKPPIPSMKSSVENKATPAVVAATSASNVKPEDIVPTQDIIVPESVQSENSTPNGTTAKGDWENDLYHKLLETGTIKRAAVIDSDGMVKRANFAVDSKGVKDILKAFDGDTSGIAGEHGIKLSDELPVYVPGKMDAGKAIYCTAVSTEAETPPGGCIILKSKKRIVLATYEDDVAAATRLAREVVERIQEFEDHSGDNKSSSDSDKSSLLGSLHELTPSEIKHGKETQGDGDNQGDGISEATPDQTPGVDKLQDDKSGLLGGEAPQKEDVESDGDRAGIDADKQQRELWPTDTTEDIKKEEIQMETHIPNDFDTSDTTPLIQPMQYNVNEKSSPEQQKDSGIEGPANGDQLTDEFSEGTSEKSDDTIKDPEIQDHSDATTGLKNATASPEQMVSFSDDSKFEKADSKPIAIDSELENNQREIFNSESVDLLLKPPQKNKSEGDFDDKVSVSTGADYDTANSEISESDLAASVSELQNKPVDIIVSGSSTDNVQMETGDGKLTGLDAELVDYEGGRGGISENEGVSLSQPISTHEKMRKENDTTESSKFNDINVADNVTAIMNVEDNKDKDEIIPVETKPVFTTQEQSCALTDDALIESVETEPPAIDAEFQNDKTEHITAESNNILSEEQDSRDDSARNTEQEQTGATDVQQSAEENDMQGKEVHTEDNDNIEIADVTQKEPLFSTDDTQRVTDQTKPFDYESGNRTDEMFTAENVGVSLNPCTSATDLVGEAGNTQASDLGSETSDENGTKEINESLLSTDDVKLETASGEPYVLNSELGINDGDSVTENVCTTLKSQTFADALNEEVEDTPTSELDEKSNKEHNNIERNEFWVSDTNTPDAIASSRENIIVEAKVENKEYAMSEQQPKSVTQEQLSLSTEAVQVELIDSEPTATDPGVCSHKDNEITVESNNLSSEHQNASADSEKDGEQEQPHELEAGGVNDRQGEEETMSAETDRGNIENEIGDLMKDTKEETVIVTENNNLETNPIAEDIAKEQLLFSTCDITMETGVNKPTGTDFRLEDDKDEQLMADNEEDVTLKQPTSADTSIENAEDSHANDLGEEKPEKDNDAEKNSEMQVSDTNKARLTDDINVKADTENVECVSSDDLPKVPTHAESGLLNDAPSSTDDMQIEMGNNKASTLDAEFDNHRGEGMVTENENLMFRNVEISLKTPERSGDLVNDAPVEENSIVNTGKPEDDYDNDHIIEGNMQGKHISADSFQNKVKEVAAHMEVKDANEGEGQMPKISEVAQTVETTNVAENLEAKDKNDAEGKGPEKHKSTGELQANVEEKSEIAVKAGDKNADEAINEEQIPEKPLSTKQLLSNVEGHDETCEVEATVEAGEGKDGDEDTNEVIVPEKQVYSDEVQNKEEENDETSKVPENVEIEDKNNAEGKGTETPIFTDKLQNNAEESVDTSEVAPNDETSEVSESVETSEVARNGKTEDKNDAENIDKWKLPEQILVSEQLQGKLEENDETSQVEAIVKTEEENVDEDTNEVSLSEKQIFSDHLQSKDKLTDETSEMPENVEAEDKNIAEAKGPEIHIATGELQKGAEESVETSEVAPNGETEDKNYAGDSDARQIPEQILSTEQFQDKVDKTNETSQVETILTSEEENGDQATNGGSVSEKKIFSDDSQSKEKQTDEASEMPENVETEDKNNAERKGTETPIFTDELQLIVKESVETSELEARDETSEVALKDETSAVAPNGETDDINDAKDVEERQIPEQSLVTKQLKGTVQENDKTSQVDETVTAEEENGDEDTDEGSVPGKQLSSDELQRQSTVKLTHETSQVPEIVEADDENDADEKGPETPISTDELQKNTEENVETSEVEPNVEKSELATYGVSEDKTDAENIYNREISEQRHSTEQLQSKIEENDETSRVEEADAENDDVDTNGRSMPEKRVYSGEVQSKEKQIDETSEVAENHEVPDKNDSEDTDKVEVPEKPLSTEENNETSEAADKVDEEPIAVTIVQGIQQKPEHKEPTIGMYKNTSEGSVSEKQLSSDELQRQSEAKLTDETSQVPEIVEVDDENDADEKGPETPISTDELQKNIEENVDTSEVDPNVEKSELATYGVSEDKTDAENIWNREISEQTHSTEQLQSKIEEYDETSQVEETKEADAENGDVGTNGRSMPEKRVCSEEVQSKEKQIDETSEVAENHEVPDKNDSEDTDKVEVPEKPLSTEENNETSEAAAEVDEESIAVTEVQGMQQKLEHEEPTIGMDENTADDTEKITDKSRTLPGTSIDDGEREADGTKSQDQVTLNVPGSEHIVEEVELMPPEDFKPLHIGKERAAPEPAPPQAQTTKHDTQKFESVDAHVEQVSKKDHSSFRNFLWHLIHGRNTQMSEMEKARAIFLWLCSKDLSKVKFDEVEEGSPEQDLLDLRDNKTTYATVFNTLCSFAGLHCQTISGRAKGAEYTPGQRFTSPQQGHHSWNAVLVDNEWRLVDCHWASRRLVGKELDNVRYKLDEYYFMPEPRELIYTHLPDDQSWQLLPTPLNQTQFEDLVLLKSAFFKYGLYLTTHMQALVEVNDEVNIRIGYPSDQANDIGFTFSLVDSNGKDEINGMKLNRFAMLEMLGEACSITVRPPAIGSYRLMVFGKNTSNSDQLGVYSGICEYKLICEENPPKPSPFPPCVHTSWGPGDSLHKYDVKTTLPGAVLTTECGKVEVRFTIGKHYRFLAKLKSNEQDEKSLQGYVMNRIVESEAIFSLFAPNKGEFGLEIYANDPTVDGKTLSHIFQFLVICEEDIEPSKPLPVTSSYLGPQPLFKDLGLNTVSHSDPFLQTSDNEVTIILKVPDSVMLTSQLFSTSNNEQLSNFILQQSLPDEVHFQFRVNQQCMYKFQIYGKSKSDTRPNFSGIYNYLIIYTGETVNQVAFPVQTSQWKDSCYLYSPTDGVLDLHAQPEEGYIFKVRVPGVKAVVVVVDTTWKYLEMGSEEGIWEGRLDFSSNKGCNAKAKLLASFEEGKFLALLEYSLLG